MDIIVGFDVSCFVTVRDGEVVHVHFLSPQRDITVRDLVSTDAYDTRNLSPRSIQETLDTVNKKVWQPLTELPDSVTWEG